MPFRKAVPDRKKNFSEEELQKATSILMEEVMAFWIALQSVVSDHPDLPTTCKVVLDGMRNYSEEIAGEYNHPAVLDHTVVSDPLESRPAANPERSEPTRGKEARSQAGSIVHQALFGDIAE